MKNLFFICLLSIVPYSFCMAAHEYIEQTQIVEEDYALPEGLLESICYAESNWQANAMGRHGEIGVCQVKPATALMVCPECERPVQYFYRGVVHQQVLPIQVLLYEKGYYDGPIDGIFGSGTYEAVRQYQLENDLRVDGIVGKRTWMRMFGTPLPFNSIRTQLSDPLRNIELAGRFIRYLMDYLGTDNPAILSAAYNGGPGHPVVVYMLRVQHIRQGEG